jgi:hypothetical protein
MMAAVGFKRQESSLDTSRQVRYNVRLTMK